MNDSKFWFQRSGAPRNFPRAGSNTRRSKNVMKRFSYVGSDPDGKRKWHDASLVNTFDEQKQKSLRGMKITD